MNLVIQIFLNDGYNSILLMRKFKIFCAYKIKYKYMNK